MRKGNNNSQQQPKLRPFNGQSTIDLKNNFISVESTFEKVRDRLCTLLDSNPIFEEFCEMLSMLLLFFDTYKMENL